MIVVELYMERNDGSRLVRTYSSDGKYIERDGEIYEEAIDPEELGRSYTETDMLIPVEQPEEQEEPEAVDAEAGE